MWPRYARAGQGRCPASRIGRVGAALLLGQEPLELRPEFLRGRHVPRLVGEQAFPAGGVDEGVVLPLPGTGSRSTIGREPVISSGLVPWAVRPSGRVCGTPMGMPWKPTASSAPSRVVTDRTAVMKRSHS